MVLESIELHLRLEIEQFKKCGQKKTNAESDLKKITAIYNVQLFKKCWFSRNVTDFGNLVLHDYLLVKKIWHFLYALSEICQLRYVSRHDFEGEGMT